MENSLIATIGSELAIMPVMDVNMAMNRRAQITNFIKQVMVSGVDYGVIPGTGDRPALLKAGAEKLTTLFGLSKKFAVLEKVEDWDGKEHDGEPFFYYIYRCGLYRGDLLIAEADGSCNSHESKYRYRRAERLCPNCGQANIRKSKQDGGWYCWQKTGGCGATFKTGDKSIESQEVGRVLNPDVADQANTILKMAQKRALVAATLLAVNASEYFSTKELPGRDEDDQPVEATFTATDEAEPPNGDLPRKPQDLLDYVNRRVEVPYDNIYHLQGGIAAELGVEHKAYKWPTFRDVEGWKKACEAAINHARAKTQPAAQAEMPF